MQFNFSLFKISQNKDDVFKITSDSILLGAWCNPPKTGHAIDIGAGTGVLSLMLAQKSNLKITAIENQKSAFNLLKKNINNSIFFKKLTPLHINFLDFLPESNVDFIISNPPYFKNSKLNKNDNLSQARHQTDLNFTSLLKKSHHWLSQFGVFAVVLPYGLVQNFIVEACSLGFYIQRRCDVKHTPNAQNAITILELVKYFTKPQNSELTIKTPDLNYSKEYLKLVQPFLPNLQPQV